MTNSKNSLRITKYQFSMLFDIINKGNVFDYCDITNSKSFLTLTGGDVANLLGIESYSHTTLTNHSALLGGRITLDEMEIPL